MVCVKHFIAPVLVYLFSAEHKGSISKASHVIVWFLQHYWFLIKAECCFQTLCSSIHPSPLRLPQHQLGSIRNPDNSRWHMPAFITKPAVTRSLICVCAERFVCGDREGEEPLAIVFFCCCFLWQAYTHCRLSERGEEFLHSSLSATMLLLWLGGPCPCQLFDIHLHLKKT